MASANVTLLLKRLSTGDQAARDELYPLIYSELHRLAAAQMARERRGHTLQPTALLHEAFLCLVKIREIDWVSRGHFFTMAAKVMRRVLISHARAEQAEKRFDPRYRVDLDSEQAVLPTRAPVLIALDSALERLEILSPRAYQLVELKFFGGLSFDEAALALNVSSRTLKRDWRIAKQWLYRELQEEKADGASA